MKILVDKIDGTDRYIAKHGDLSKEFYRVFNDIDEKPCFRIYTILHVYVGIVHTSKKPTIHALENGIKNTIKVYLMVNGTAKELWNYAKESPLLNPILAFRYPTPLLNGCCANIIRVREKHILQIVDNEETRYFFVTAELFEIFNITKFDPFRSKMTTGLLYQIALDYLKNNKQLSA